MRKYFYERMSPMGRWSPQVSADMPSTKNTKIRALTSLTDEDRELTFDELLAKYKTKEAAPEWATHRHVKTGKFYVVTGEGRLEVTGDDAYSLVEYQDEKGNRYAQNAARFNDGRFQALPAVQRDSE